MTLADWLKTLKGNETPPAPKAEDDLFSGF